jgi:hypothetical protein
MLRFGVIRRAGVLAAGALAATAIVASPAAAQTGGASAPGSEPATTGAPGKAKLLKSGKAIPPSNAPARVVRAIEAANRIRKKPYVYGGGHASFKSKGYDCSGAVSYALRGAKMLKSPLPSGPLMKWGTKGKGKWITVYANPGHAYMVIAGLRFDTSSAGDSRSQGEGPRWRYTKRAPGGYKVRHFPGY